MSDLGPTPHDDELRRLLRDAREREPMPADVVARLEGVLDELRQEGPPVRPPSDLAAARRRRTRWRNALVAAAAVVVVGYGVSQVGLSGGASDDAGSASRSTTSQDEAGDGGAGGGRAAAPSPGSSAPAGVPPVGLDAKGFESQVRLPESARNHLSLGVSDGAAACDDPAWGAGLRVPATYDGKPGVLVYRPARGDTQRVLLFLCGQTEPTRSTTVPAR